MSEKTHLTVLFLLTAALTLMSIIGTFITSPALGIPAVIFLGCSVAVWLDLRGWG